jgi:phosphoribosylformylglycinamidine synthase I
MHCKLTNLRLKTTSMKSKPKILVFSGYGLNCEEETKYAFELAGGQADIVHVNDLISGEKKIKNYDILAFPGGFSYGDDTGSGKAYANKVRNHLGKDLEEFVSKDKLIIGICNGFQILTNLGILPGSLTYNEGARYLDRWVDVKIENPESPWLKGITALSLPIAHGEGKFYADEKTLKDLNKNDQIAARYIKGDISSYLSLPANPNGALEDIAGVLGYEGRVLGMMPHPERALFVSQMPNFPYLKEKARREGGKLPKNGPGFQIFKNAIEYFK